MTALVHQPQDCIAFDQVVCPSGEVEISRYDAPEQVVEKLRAAGLPVGNLIGEGDTMGILHRAAKKAGALGQAG